MCKIGLTERISWAVFVFISALALFSCKDNGINPKDIKTLRLALPNQPTALLAKVAESQGFYKQVGLDVQTKVYPSGKRALNAFLRSGEFDVVISQEIPFVIQSFEYKNLRVLAELCHADSIQSIVARRDAGIEKVSDLHGKTIGTQKNSAVHFYLYAFAHFYGIDQNSITVDFRKAEELVTALEDGEIDAMSMREPFIGQAIDRLGKENVVIFQEGGIYQSAELLITNAEILEEKRESLKRLLQAFALAEEHILQTNIVGNKKQLALLFDGLSSEELQRYDFRLHMDNMIYTYMDRAYHWHQSNNEAASVEIDYSKYVYPDLLKEVKSEFMH